jgi:hypothetical protein
LTLIQYRKPIPPWVRDQLSCLGGRVPCPGPSRVVVREAEGIAVIANEKVEPSFTAPAGELERLFYGYSLFTCLPPAMTERPTAATGT